jgi:hypothetical protein
MARLSKLADQLASWRCNLLIALKSAWASKIRLVLFDRLLSKWHKLSSCVDERRARLQPCHMSVPR